MDAATDSAVRTNGFGSFEIFSLRLADNFLVGQCSGRAGVDALATERAGRFKKFIVEERGDRVVLSSTLDGNSTGLFPVVTDICAAEARDAVIVVTLNERVVVFCLFSNYQRREGIPFGSVFFSSCVKFAFLERKTFWTVRWRRSFRSD